MARRCLRQRNDSAGAKLHNLSILEYDNFFFVFDLIRLLIVFQLLLLIVHIQRNGCASIFFGCVRGESLRIYARQGRTDRELPTQWTPDSVDNVLATALIGGVFRSPGIHASGPLRWSRWPRT